MNSETKEIGTSPKVPDSRVEDNILQNAWLVRPCESYKDEYSECSSFKGKFHQYFIFGKTIDCNQWYTDYENCQKYRLKKDMDALRAVVESENVRRYNRLAPHFKNDVWEHRSSPPEDWNKPLPKDMQNKLKDTYLDFKAQEYKTSQSS